MHKIKNLIFLLVALCVLTLGAFLPTLTARYQDEASLGDASYRDMDSIQLSLYQEESDEPVALTDVDKLQLLCGNSFPIPEDQASMTPDEVCQTAELALWPYLNSGLVDAEMSQMNFDCAPLLYYFSGLPDATNIVWNVSTDVGISMLLDDDSGKLLYIKYKSLRAYESEDFASLAGYLASIYLAPLELLTENHWTRGGLLGCDVVMYGEGEYKKMELEFGVAPYGFSVIVDLPPQDQ